jgi:hypothetical protein
MAIISSVAQGLVCDKNNISVNIVLI